MSNGIKRIALFAAILWYSEKFFMVQDGIRGVDVYTGGWTKLRAFDTVKECEIVAGEMNNEENLAGVTRFHYHGLKPGLQVIRSTVFVCWPAGVTP